MPYILVEECFVKERSVATMKQLRERAHMTIFELAVASGVSIRTINRIENSPEHEVTSLTAMKLTDALSERLGQEITPQTVEGLRIKK
jgi:transcriptional regulator with XRE-family HTH domain